MGVEGVVQQLPCQGQSLMCQKARASGPGAGLTHGDDSCRHQTEEAG